VWDFEKLAFTDNYNIDQQALLTDFLLYRFRLYSKDTLENLIPSCVEENVPIVFKSAFIKACLALAQNEHPLPWDVPLTSMYSQLGPLIQKVFLQTIQIDMEKPSRKDYTYSTHSSRVDLLHDALLLFRTNCAIGLLHPDLTDFNATLMVGLATLYQHPNQTVRQAAGDLLIKMHKSDTIALWGPTLFHFWKISSQAVFVLARQILENKSNEQNIKSILRLLHQILKTRNKYIKSAQVR
jgi:neurofibromin 1